MLLVELYETLLESVDKPAMVYQGQIYSYQWLSERIAQLQEQFKTEMVAGTVVQLITDFSPNSVAALIALMLEGMIISPLTRPTENKRSEYEKVVNAEVVIRIDKNDEPHVTQTLQKCTNPLVQKLRSKQNPGLIILSSGSSGKSKAIVHDLSLLIGKLKNRSKSYSTIAFLLFDHIGGLNTLFQTLINHGTIVVPCERSPQSICMTIERYKVEALVTSPSFLNLLLLSQWYKQYNLSSLNIINYGSEPMPIYLLKKLVALFPKVRFSQAYGMSELGVLNVRSKASDSLLIKISDQSASVRIVDGLLEIKSTSSMLGYINAASPFTDDGWLKTGDRVEVEGEYIRILGRESDIINVGGEKVYPAEIESVLMEIDGIEDVAVIGEANVILGNIVKAKIKVKNNVDFSMMKKSIRSYCQKRLPAFKIPQKIEKLTEFTHNERFKKVRRAA